MAAYLGVTPENDAQGCLQDVHWSAGREWRTGAQGNGVAGSCRLHVREWCIRKRIRTLRPGSHVPGCAVSAARRLTPSRAPSPPPSDGLLPHLPAGRHVSAHTQRPARSLNAFEPLLAPRRRGTAHRPGMPRARLCRLGVARRAREWVAPAPWHTPASS